MLNFNQLFQLSFSLLHIQTGLDNGFACPDLSMQQ